MAQLFGASWLCLLLAGMWSLACGMLLRKVLTAEADEERAAQVSSSRNEVLRLRSDLDTRNARVQALEADFAGGQARLAELEASKATEVASLTQKLSSFEAKAAGFDLARNTSLKTIAERDQVIADLNARLQTSDLELAEARRQTESSRAAADQAVAELAQARSAWDIERGGLVDQHAQELGALQRSRADSEKGLGAEITALAAKVAALSLFETRAQALGSDLQAQQAAMAEKTDALTALEGRVKSLEPLTGMLAATERELADSRRLLAERDAKFSRLEADIAKATEAAGKAEAELAALRGRVKELEPWQGRFTQAETDLGRLKARVAELEPWQAKAGQAEAELGKLKARVAELTPWQGKATQAEADLGKLKARVAELEPWPAKAAQADAELARLRTRIAELEPWQGKFSQAEADVRKLNARVSELEPWRGKFTQADTELGTLRARVSELAPWQGRFNQSEAELARLRAQVTELQSLQERLRLSEHQHAISLKERDDNLTRIAAELRGRIGTLDEAVLTWRRRHESAEKDLAARDGQIDALNRRIEELRNAPPKIVEKIVEVEKVVEVEKIVEVNRPSPAATTAVEPARPFALASPAPAAAPRAPAPAPASPPRRDDLKVIEGIGPKIEKLLNNAGYLTFRSVAAADPKALAAILEQAGPRFALARTETWPEQARLLADNEMEAFKKLTDELKGGVRR